ncbi:MAG: hypothetical protein GQ574_19540 [Crocinitomix sp.]|nr:hypothetical protein [Crocinitomix sp.]
MKKIIPFIFLFIVTACSSENILHIKLPETYGLQIDNQIQSEGQQLGTITDVKLFDKGQSILVSAKLNTAVEIPIDSKFEVVPIDVLGSKMIEVTYSNQSEFYHSNDTVVGFYIDPFENLMDSLLLNTVNQLIETTIILDSLEAEYYLDSIFKNHTSIVIPTH